jgi:hypothetical protein
MDPLVNYTTYTQLGGWMMHDGCSVVDLSLSSLSTFVLFRALFDLILLKIALRLHFLVLKPVARWGFRVGITKTTVKKPVAM